VGEAFCSMTLTAEFVTFRGKKKTFLEKVQRMLGL
jgi:hypothetical protein